MSDTELVHVKTTITKRGKKADAPVRSIKSVFKAPKVKKAKVKKARKPATKPAAKLAKSTTAKGPAKGTIKGEGVIDTIIAVLKAEGGISLVDLTAKIAKKFPQRDAAGLFKTCRAQIQRLPQPKEAGGRGIKVKKVKQEGTRVKLYLI